DAPQEERRSPPTRDTQAGRRGPPPGRQAWAPRRRCGRPGGGLGADVVQHGPRGPPASCDVEEIADHRANEAPETARAPRQGPAGVPPAWWPGCGDRVDARPRAL